MFRDSHGGWGLTVNQAKRFSLKHHRTLLALLAAAALTGCTYFERAAATDRPIWEFDLGGDEPLEAPPADAPHSPYQPQKPYEQFVEGMLTRTVVRLTQDGLALEIRDLLIGPNQNTEVARLPGTAVITVLDGRGVLQIAEGDGQPKRTIDIEVGSTATIIPGQAFSVSNRTDRQIHIRVRLFAAQ